MEAARRMLLMLRGAFLLSIVVFAVMVKMLPTAVTPNVVIGWALTLLAITDVAIIFVFRRTMITPAERTLASEMENPAALARWRNGYMYAYGFSESIAVYGLALHFLGFSFAQAMPFFIAGFVLILFYAPRRPVAAR